MLKTPTPGSGRPRTEFEMSSLRVKLLFIFSTLKVSSGKKYMET